jgi:Ca-activated chloride channel family protein
MADAARTRRLQPAALPPPPRSFWWRAGIELIPWGILLVLAGITAFALWLYLRGGPLKWAHPFGFFGLFLVAQLAFIFFHLDRWRRAPMSFTRTADLAATTHTFMRHLAHLPRALRVLALGLLVFAYARPQRPAADMTEVEGIDIVIALDVSNSMSEQDLAPNRLAAAKEVLRRFIEHRKSDRVGLVIFGREAFTQCPLTLDYHALSGLLADVRLDLVDGRGTAIGNALGTALNRLRRSDAKSKVIILLTDGDNNAGNLAPMQAARYAQSLGVKIFTILMGRDATQAQSNDLFANVFRPPPRYPVNPKLLEEIAGATGGTPYLATDTPALERRFQAILDELDRSRIKDVKGKPLELYGVFVAAALGLLLVELMLSLTRFRRFP